ncbi:MAG: ribose 5-phosphate isomerase B [Anaerolineae bacterium]|nr:ribose 5-phosphate isomerase B [Anaerolineae bacterium]MCB0245182.1 ribose 5-phosphate isomerase B [Anaerolineae bacterium]
MTLPPSEDQVRRLVRQSLERLLGAAELPTVQREQPVAQRRQIVDAQQIAQAAPGSTVVLPPSAVITPLARDLALERNVTLATGVKTPQPSGPAEKTVAIGADHGGYALKEQLKPVIAGLGWQVVDCGTFSTDSVDYPDYAYAVARLVADGRARWGIMVDGAGIGSCMVANKVPGVRAALCYDLASAANSREHNHANVLTLGAGLIGPSLAQQIVKVWLETPFGPDRHARRVEKITQIEGRYLRK